MPSSSCLLIFTFGHDAERVWVRGKILRSETRDEPRIPDVFGMPDDAHLVRSLARAGFAFMQPPAQSQAASAQQQHLADCRLATAQGAGCHRAFENLAGPPRCQVALCRGLYPGHTVKYCKTFGRARGGGGGGGGGGGIECSHGVLPVVSHPARVIQALHCMPAAGGNN